MAGRIYFAGIYMTKGVPNLERGFDRPKLGTPFSFLRCFPFCGRVLRTAPLDKKGNVFTFPFLFIVNPVTQFFPIMLPDMSSLSTLC